MDIIRRFFSFANRTETSEDSSNLLTLPCYYIGNTYVDQANGDELRRAIHILMSKAKRDLDKNLLPLMSLCFDNNSTVFLKSNDSQKTSKEYELRKIVLSCVDAKNQKHFAIFYHSFNTFVGAAAKLQGMECHLFLCKSKEKAKVAATRIGELLSQEYQVPTAPTENLQVENVRLSKLNYDDIDYENISKFFEKKNSDVEMRNSRNHSALSSRYSSISTFVTTNGGDSGCASTVASVDIRNDDLMNGFHGPPIPERDEPGPSHRRTSAELIGNIDDHETVPNSIFHNRYSVHYDLEDQVQEETDNQNNDDDTLVKNDMNILELQKLINMNETNI